MNFPTSALALELLGPLGCGIEVGPAAHNAFALPNSIFIDFMLHPSSAPRGAVKAAEPGIQPIDLLAQGDRLPFADRSVDYVLSSHVIEHFFDPIGALQEWMRVIRPGGLLFMIVPHCERTFDKGRPRTGFAELVDRHAGRLGPPILDPAFGGHYSVWSTLDMLELCSRLGFHVERFQDVDDKVGNGFTVVLRKPATAARPAPQPLRRAAAVLADMLRRTEWPRRRRPKAVQTTPTLAWHVDQCWVDLGGTYLLGWIHAFDEPVLRIDASIGATTVNCPGFHRRDDVAASHASARFARDSGFEIFIPAIGAAAELRVQTATGTAVLDLNVAELAAVSEASIDRRLFRRIPLSGPPVRLFYNVEVFWVDRRGLLLEGWTHCCEQPMRSLAVEVGGRTATCDSFARREDVARLFADYPEAGRCGFSIYLDCRPCMPVTLVVETDLGRHRFQVVFPEAGGAPGAAGPPAASSDCFNRFLSLFSAAPGLVVELGSRHVSPAYKDIRGAVPPAGRYIGVDIHPGPGVDLVADAHHLSQAIAPGSADYLISLSVLEHLAQPWLVAGEINRVLRLGGQVFIDVPWTWPAHELPNDFWRISDEGLKLLFGPATGFEVVEAGQHSEFRVYPEERKTDIRHMPMFPSYGGSFIQARKIAEIPVGAIAWPSDPESSRIRAICYPAHENGVAWPRPRP